MGRYKWDNLINKAKHVMKKVPYNGNNPRFTLKRHILGEREAFNDMRRASDADNYSYQVPDEHTQVQRLL